MFYSSRSVRQGVFTVRNFGCLSVETVDHGLRNSFAVAYHFPGKIWMRYWLNTLKMFKDMYNKRKEMALSIYNATQISLLRD